MTKINLWRDCLGRLTSCNGDMVNLLDRDTRAITYTDSRVGGVGNLDLGVHGIPKEIKKYQNGWQRIKDL